MILLIYSFLFLLLLEQRTKLFDTLLHFHNLMVVAESYHDAQTLDKVFVFFEVFKHVDIKLEHLDQLGTLVGDILLLEHQDKL